MKFFSPIVFFVFVLVSFVGCGKDDLAPVKAIPNGQVKHSFFTKDLFFLNASIDAKVDRTPDSTGTFFHDRHNLFFTSTQVDTALGLTPPGFGSVSLQFYVPENSGLQDGQFFSLSNKFCKTDEADRSFFCELVVEDDINNDGSINFLEMVLVTEGILTISSTETSRIFEFRGVGQSQEKVTLNYEHKF